MPFLVGWGKLRVSMVPRERVKREHRALWLDHLVRGQVGGCPRNCQR